MLCWNVPGTRTFRCFKSKLKVPRINLAQKTRWSMSVHTNSFEFLSCLLGFVLTFSADLSIFSKSNKTFCRATDPKTAEKKHNRTEPNRHPISIHCTITTKSSIYSPLLSVQSVFAHGLPQWGTRADQFSPLCALLVWNPIAMRTIFHGVFFEGSSSNSQELPLSVAPSHPFLLLFGGGMTSFSSYILFVPNFVSFVIRNPTSRNLQHFFLFDTKQWKQGTRGILFFFLPDRLTWNEDAFAENKILWNFSTFCLWGVFAKQNGCSLCIFWVKVIQACSGNHTVEKVGPFTDPYIFLAKHVA